MSPVRLFPDAAYAEVDGSGEVEFACASRLPNGAHACTRALRLSYIALAEGHAFEQEGLLGSGLDDAGDAFRHCFWCALMTLDLGTRTSTGIGAIHEERRDRSTYPQRQSKRMDLHNNDLGAAFALLTARRYGADHGADNTDDVFDVEARCLREALPGGRLWILLPNARNGYRKGTLIYPDGAIVFPNE